MSTFPMSISRRCPRCNGWVRARIVAERGQRPEIVELTCSSEDCPVSADDVLPLLRWPADE